MSAELAGRRILVVEDESLVAMLIETILEDLGGETVGPGRYLPLNSAFISVRLISPVTSRSK